MRIKDCNNTADFRKLAKKRLPAPLFHYIDGGSDDEVTMRRNTEAFNDVRLIPNVLADLSSMDLSVNVLGQDIDWPVFCSPTGMNRLFHHDGERAVCKAAKNSKTMYSLSTVSTVSIEEIGALTPGPKCFQLYIHRDRGLSYAFIERCKEANFSALCLTVDTLVAGNRERDLQTGMSIPPKFTFGSLLSFAAHPGWGLNYLTSEKFQLANVVDEIEDGSGKLTSVIDYINRQFDRSITWKDAEQAVAAWGGPFAIKGIMSVEDARRAVDVGASAIMISNHGGRQLDGAVAPFDQLPAIVDAVGDKIEVILDGGVRRGTHVLKALALGAKACMIGRGYLYALAAGGQPGVERALSRLRDEVERDMILMGCSNIKQLNRSRLQFD
ncbi:MAG: alpha-hydroxy-acid oxidizing enzyme [SAR86 cluster bacterium]|uniref:Alpha-hydroxy-acid oxidizing enzyme n=1 Tax=SAR86 cluster bacterium TaxID=2030880 RepID=A0A2A5ASV7_9GAMM|nr:MAG: alpha-hydroxy-acid oxidizing enzyme [SAR86 cluster bacterium]